MLAQYRTRLNRHPYFKTIIEWGLLFVGLIIAIYAATQSRAAPQTILMVLLTVTTINFSLPASQGSIGLFPVVGVASILILGDCRHLPPPLLDWGLPK